MKGRLRKHISERGKVKKLIIGNTIFSALMLLDALLTPFFEIVEFLFAIVEFILIITTPFLLAVNIASAKKYWHQYKALSLVPVALLVVGVALFVPMARLGVILSEFDTPFHPMSYFSENREQEMTELAEALLDYPINEIREGYDSIEIFTNDNTHYRNMDFVPIEEKLKNSDFQFARVDYVQKIVRLYSRKNRTWCNYTYARNGLGYPFTTMPCTITDADILDWNELIIIACVGNSDSYNRSCLSFLLTMAYPLLEKGIDEELRDKLSYIDNTDSLLPHERQKIIDMLNKLRLASSRLIEDSRIRYGIFKGSSGLTLKLDYASIGEDSWITKLLRELINKGVITLADNEGHMKIKQNLSDAEELSIEWLHAGILNVIYGNFLGKDTYTFVTILSDNWYYCPPEENVS